jgi:hypothetical protein
MLTTTSAYLTGTAARHDLTTGKASVDLPHRANVPETSAALDRRKSMFAY